MTCAECSLSIVGRDFQRQTAVECQTAGLGRCRSSIVTAWV